MHRAIYFCTILQRLCSLPFYHGLLAQINEIWRKFIILSLITTLEKNVLELGPIQVECYSGLPPVGGRVKRQMTFETRRMSHVNSAQVYHDSTAHTEETNAQNHHKRMESIGFNLMYMHKLDQVVSIATNY